MQTGLSADDDKVQVESSQHLAASSCCICNAHQLSQHRLSHTLLYWF